METRKMCWGNAVHTHGSAYIFETRKNKLQKYRRRLLFVGIAVPVFIGGSALTLGSGSKVLPFLVPIGSTLLIVQLVWSVWSLVANWEDRFSYATESTAANYRMASEFERLGSLNPENIELRFELLKTENTLRSTQDYAQGVTDKEKRMGMRRALWKYQRECPVCKLIPKDMNPSQCSNCGHF